MTPYSLLDFRNIVEWELGWHGCLLYYSVFRQCHKCTWQDTIYWAHQIKNNVPVLIRVRQMQVQWSTRHAAPEGKSEFSFLVHFSLPGLAKASMGSSEATHSSLISLEGCSELGKVHCSQATHSGSKNGNSMVIQFRGIFPGDICAWDRNWNCSIYCNYIESFFICHLLWISLTWPAEIKPCGEKGYLQNSRQSLKQQW